MAGILAVILAGIFCKNVGKNLGKNLGRNLGSNAPINVMPARGRGGGKAWGGDLIVFVGSGVGHLP